MGNHPPSPPVRRRECAEWGTVGLLLLLRQRSPFSWSISAYIHCCLLFRFKKKYAGLFRSSSDSKSSSRGDESNSPQHSEGSPRAHTWCILLLLLWQGCTRSVVLSSCCLVPVICGVSKISDPYHDYPSVMYVKALCLFGRQCKDGLVHKLQLKRLLCYRPNWRDLWTCNGDAHEMAAQRKYGVWWRDKWPAPIKESASTTAATRA